MTQQKQLTDKEVLNKVFRDLRKAGFKARQNFQCCQTCGWYAMEIEYNANANTPAVFYHRQDKDDALHNLTLKKTLYLAWQGSGEKIKAIIEMNGFEVEWTGNGADRIGIKPRG